MNSSPSICQADVVWFLSTLKRLDHVLLALDLHHHASVRSLSHLMTNEQKGEVIGRIERLKEPLGNVYVEFYLTGASPSCSKTDSTI